ncbi:hypothetical protein [uncultured phage MedDCM-OCT-S04-C1161]|nr:hypothetical protein [uncultured phage MedDCM-OCT-S04-C1035]ADD94135.1 hypothetical protein [uncultured phage MedDCM-OCT-S04-C1161]ADD94343.1 hypothetical protein [uncultured phage MedDCM-OCT-S04-C890]
MVGRPMRKVFCQGFTRAGLREGKKIPCRMKGYPLSGGKVFKCKYHGYQNYDKFNKANYTDESRIKQLSKLIQFRNYTDEQIKEYYYTKTKPRINNKGKSVYHRRKIGKRNDAFRDHSRQAVSVQLDEVLCLLEKKSRTRNKDT